MTFNINPNTNKGTCALCGRPCLKDYIFHTECCIALEELKKNRIKILKEKYGEGLKFEQIIIKESDLK